jgi:hypothetical protein
MLPGIDLHTPCSGGRVGRMHIEQDIVAAGSDLGFGPQWLGQIGRGEPAQSYHDALGFGV